MNRQIKSRSNESRRNAHRDRQIPRSPLVRIARGAGIAMIASLLFSFLLLLIASGIAVSYSDPDALLFPLSFLILAVSSLFCGVIAMRLSHAEALPTGMVAGGLWVLITFILSLTIGDGVGSLPTVYAFALRIPQFLLVLLGSFIAKRRPRKITSRRRR